MRSFSDRQNGVDWARRSAIQNIVHPLNMAPPVCRASSIRACVYYFFLAVAVVRYETTATARWALLFIVRAFFNDTVTVAIWTGFHVRLMGGATTARNYIRWCFADPAVAAAFATEFKRTRDAVMSLNSAAQQAEAICHHRPRLCLRASVAERLLALPPAIARGGYSFRAHRKRRISQVRQCGAPMWVSRIEPDKLDHDKRTFECPDCENVIVEVVKYR